MSEHQPTESASTDVARHRKRHLEEAALGVLAILSLIGIAIADFSAQQSFRYWVAIAPVFAAVSIFTSWSRARAHERAAMGFLGQQLMHWLVLPVTVYLIYLMEQTGRLNREDAGLVALLALAVTTFLAGVHFDWRLAVVGAGLAAGALVAALVEEFFWVFLVVAIPLIAVAIWRRRASPSEPS